MPKIGRNEKCDCGSNKKYKVCCLTSDQKLMAKAGDILHNGQNSHSELIKDLIEYLQEIFPDHKIINISNFLNEKTYRKFQINHYSNKIIMVAERNQTNEEIFKTHGTPDNDIIIMYRGSYRTYHHPNLPNVMESLCGMIENRLAGKLE